MDLIRILKHIEDLYSPKDITEEKIKVWVEKYQERAKLWQDELKNYSDCDIIQAVNEYWRFKDNVKKPKIVHIQAILNTSKTECYQSLNTDEQEECYILAEKTKKQLYENMIKKFGC